MSRTIAAFSGLTVLLVAILLLAAWFLLVDTSALQARAESALTDALGSDARIQGGLRVRPLPSPRVLLDDVVADDLRVDRLDVLVAPLSLLRGDLSVRSLRATNARLKVPGGEGEDLELSGCEVDLQALRTGYTNNTPLPRQLAFDADLTCDRVEYGDVAATAVSARLEAADGVFDADPISLDLLEGSASGKLRSDLSGDTAAHDLTFEIDGFSVEALVELMTDEPLGEGSLTLEAELSSRGLEAADLWQYLEGTVLLTGESLTLHGVDVDERVSDYESASAFDLYDVGAVLLVGPLGLVATRGRNYARLLSESGESTDIERLHAEWRIEAGVATARDVALRTPHNLIALQGALDFNEQRYDDLIVAVVDAERCAFVEQRVTGTFEDPDVQSPSVLEALAEPAVDLLERAAEFFGAECCDEPFYDGALGHPRDDDRE